MPRNISHSQSGLARNVRKRNSIPVYPLPGASRGQPFQGQFAGHDIEHDFSMRSDITNEKDWRRQRGPARMVSSGEGSGFSTPDRRIFHGSVTLAPDRHGACGKGRAACMPKAKRGTAMSLNTFGHLFRVTTWGESHGPAIGCTVDGCPPASRCPRPTSALAGPAQARHLEIHHPAQGGGRGAHPVGRVRGATTGTPIQLMIENTDQRSKDYGEIAQPSGPAMPTSPITRNTGMRDYRGGGRSSARETASRVAAGAWRGRCWRRWCRG
jgi:hypothetical protein